MEEELGVRLRSPNFVHCRLSPLTKFCSTLLMESDDQRLMAMTKQTTKLAGSCRFRSSVADVSLKVCVINSGAITVSRA